MSNRPAGFGLDATFFTIPNACFEMDLYHHGGGRIYGGVGMEVAVLFQMVAAVRLLDPDATIRIRGCTCRSCNASREVDHMIVVGLDGVAR